MQILKNYKNTQISRSGKYRAGMTAMLAVTLLFGNAFVGNAETFDPEPDSIATEVIEDIGDVGELENSIEPAEPIELVAEAEYRVVDDGEAGESEATEEADDTKANSETSAPAGILVDDTTSATWLESDLKTSSHIDNDSEVSDVEIANAAARGTLMFGEPGLFFGLRSNTWHNLSLWVEEPQNVGSADNGNALWLAKVTVRNPWNWDVALNKGSLVYQNPNGIFTRGGCRGDGQEIWWDYPAPPGTTTRYWCVVAPSGALTTGQFGVIDGQGQANVPTWLFAGHTTPPAPEVGMFDNPFKYGEEIYYSSSSDNNIAFWIEQPRILGSEIGNAPTGMAYWLAKVTVRNDDWDYYRVSAALKSNRHNLAFQDVTGRTWKNSCPSSVANRYEMWDVYNNAPNKKTTTRYWCVEAPADALSSGSGRFAITNSGATQYFLAGSIQPPPAIDGMFDKPYAFEYHISWKAPNTPTTSSPAEIWFEQPRNISGEIGNPSTAGNAYWLTKVTVRNNHTAQIQVGGNIALGYQTPDGQRFRGGCPGINAKYDTWNQNPKAPARQDTVRYWCVEAPANGSGNYFIYNSSGTIAFFGGQQAPPANKIFDFTVAIPTVVQVNTAATPTISYRGGKPADTIETYAWFSDGTAIPGATKKSYTPVAADAGKALSVKVSASAPDYIDKTVESNSVRVATPPASKDIVAGSARVDGVLQVGQTLTAATPKKFNPADATLSYQWLRDGKPIGGQAGKASSYKLVTADVGTKISVTITASKSGYTSATVTSPATAKVSGGAITAGTARVDGVLQVGQTLTAVTPKKFNPSDATLSYQWLRDDKPIGGQAGKASSYKLATADVGTKISVTIMASKAGYTAATATSTATAKVSGGAIVAGTARVDGVLQVGQTLTAAMPKKFNPADATLVYQWLRDGKPIGGQAGKASSYKLATADVGAKISVTITGSKAGYTSATATSPATAKVSGGVISAGTARVDGVLQVGQTLTAATPKKFSPTDITLAYQWLRDGKPIGGQAGKTPTYKLVTADVGAKISVTITASKSGYTSATATAPARGPVVK